jgi:glucose-6-phosphate isomerase
MYERCRPDIVDNPAKKLALGLFSAYEKGYNEIFMPVYSTALSGFNQLIVQLLHESCGKQGKGHTIYAALAPESQHHTNQRFFGGKKNVIGLFVKQTNFSSEVIVKVPAKAKNVKLKENTLGLLNGMKMSKALEFEYQGTQEDAENNKIPNITIAVEKINEFTLGEYLGLWQYTTVYLATLFGVNPFDQPQVENSKRISYELTKNFSKPKL